MIFFYLSIALLLLVLYVFVYGPLVYWRKRKLPHDTPLPFLGSMAPIVFRQRSFLDLFDDIYQRNKHHRCVGLFQMMTPSLMINDPELIKQVTVKYFDNFMDHRQLSDPSVEVLLTKNLFALNGQEWKDMRNLLSPAFTGSKMRLMCGLMAECAQRWVDHYEKVITADNNTEKMFEGDIKDMFRKYSSDVIATCAFGLECDSVNDPDNTFFKLGKEATNFQGLKGLRAMLANFAPKLVKVFKVRMFSAEVTDFFIETIRQTIQYRDDNNFSRPDMIQLLLEARKGNLKYDEAENNKSDDGFAVIEESNVGKSGISDDIRESLTVENMAAQAFIFFIAGFDNISTQLSLIATELAINPEVQEKLYREIEEVMIECKGRPTYESVVGMKYLDMVMCESLRKWPQGVALDRKCTKEFTIEPSQPGELPIHLKPGDVVTASIVGIQRDPRYFADPMRFDPERFSDENKGNIVPYTYIPFGMGPRACIGSRFAILENKLLIVYLVHRFQLHVVEKTSVPLTLSAKKINIEPEHGYWIGLTLRK